MLTSKHLEMGGHLHIVIV